MVNNKSCITLNSLKNTTDLAINSTSEPISTLVMYYPPYLLYTDWEIKEVNKSILYYQFCGPLIVLLKSFAKHINTE